MDNKIFAAAAMVTDAIAALGTKDARTVVTLALVAIGKPNLLSSQNGGTTKQSNDPYANTITTTNQSPDDES